LPDEVQFTSNLGAWADQNLLAGYEFRMCSKLYEVTNKPINGKKLSIKEKSGWVERYCADISTLEDYRPQEYYKIKPYDRLFIWLKDLNEAVEKLNLVPAH